MRMVLLVLAVVGAIATVGVVLFVDRSGSCDVLAERDLFDPVMDVDETDPKATMEEAVEDAFTDAGTPRDVKELYLRTQKHVVAHGHVSGIEWSLAAYDTRAAAGFKGGPCGDLFVGDLGEYGGIYFCLHTEETHPSAQFALAGFGNNSDPMAGPVVGYAGLVGPQVATVELRYADGTTSELTLFDAPSSIEARYFAVFVGEGTAGRVVALRSDGTEVDHERLCVGQVAETYSNVGCGHGLHDGPASVVTTAP